jgi:hypothetical protein
MIININNLKQTQAKLGHKWFEDQPNIIGIRTTLCIPDQFNDVLAIVYRADGKTGEEKIFTAIITTEPGTTYQKKLLNPRGCAVMQPGQFINAYKLGYHQGKKDHRCLKQVGKILLKRDKDLDGIPGNSGVVEWNTDAGCNIHGANKGQVTAAIGPWSAGCQVHERWSKKEEMCDIAQIYEKVNNGLLTYSLVEERYMVSA